MAFDLHVAVAWVMVISNAAAGIWALLANWYPRLRRRELWWTVGFAQVSVAVQAILGVLVLQEQDRAYDQLHVIYGFVSLATVGIIYSYRQQLEHRIYLLYGLGCLFLMGMGIRGMILTPA
ncbi:MAG: hypothetical protein ACK5RL_20885 [Acidimicrobiales bacterium]